MDVVVCLSCKNRGATAAIFGSSPPPPTKTIKRYDVPKTPYQRVVESPYIPQKTKDAMTKYLETLNPFLLKKALEEKLKKIFSLSSSG